MTVTRALMSRSSRRILFRATCSHADGTGHLRRCLTLAAILEAREFAVEVVTDDTGAARQIAGESRIGVRHVGRDELGAEGAGTPSVLVIDAPTGDDNLLDQRATLERVAEYDHAGVAVVSLGHVGSNLTNFRAVFDLYPQKKVAAANYFEGPEYLVLRPEFVSRADRKERSRNTEVLVAMGGSDPFDLTRFALEGLGQARYAGKVHVVLGAAYAGSVEDLRALTRLHNLSIEIHRDLDADRFAGLMRECKAALVGFGTTAYEAMALGVPALTFAHYRWQEPSTELFTALGALHHLGCAECGLSVDEVGNTLSDILGDESYLAQLGRTGPQVVDGQGASRIADLLQGFAAEEQQRQLDALYVLAHPGDEVLGCGGTLLKQIAAGRRVGVLVLGEGSASRYGATERAQQMMSAQSEIRSSLQRSMERLNISVWYYCRFEDNRFDRHDLLDVVQFIESLIQRHSPRTVYTHHPGDLNIDHRRTFEAAITAVRPVANGSVRSLYSVEVPSSTDWGAPLGRGAFVPNWFEDVSSVLDQKVELLREYASELRDDPHPRSVEGIRDRAVYWGRLCGLPAAEAFVLQRCVQSDSSENV